MNEKKKGLNVIDIIIIVLVLLIIAAAAFIFLRPQGSESNEARYIDFIVELPTVKDKFKDLIKKGDPVLETVRHTSIGQVVEVIYEDAVIATTNMNEGGTMKMSKYPDHQRVLITIRSPYSINENGEFSVEGTTIAVGAFLNFSTPDFITSGYCIDLEPLTAEENTEWKTQLESAKKEVTENGTGK